MLNRLFVLPLSLLFSVSLPTLAENQAQPSINRTVLLENSVTMPEYFNSKVTRVVFPPAFTTPEHTHDGPGPRYVVKGELKVIEGNKSTIYKAGEVFWETGALMSVENLSNTPAELILFEMLPVKSVNSH
ncbi:MAG: cupin domain-containing protein [Methylovulum sp.]|jgi:quercetin dioxygenase-like cupin family protein|nr:cupin domain-containing protein [Methylovulum sp.]